VAHLPDGGEDDRRIVRVAREIDASAATSSVSASSGATRMAAM
jgi:hypothetical protein